MSAQTYTCACTMDAHTHVPAPHMHLRHTHTPTHAHMHLHHASIHVHIYALTHPLTRMCLPHACAPMHPHRHAHTHRHMRAHPCIHPRMHRAFISNGIRGYSPAKFEWPWLWDLYLAFPKYNIPMWMQLHGVLVGAEHRIKSRQF